MHCQNQPTGATTPDSFFNKTRRRVQIDDDEHLHRRQLIDQLQDPSGVFVSPRNTSERLRCSPLRNQRVDIDEAYSVEDLLQFNAQEIVPVLASLLRNDIIQLWTSDRELCLQWIRLYHELSLLLRLHTSTFSFCSFYSFVRTNFRH